MDSRRPTRPASCGRRPPATSKRPKPRSRPPRREHATAAVGWISAEYCRTAHRRRGVSSGTEAPVVAMGAAVIDRISENLRGLFVLLAEICKLFTLGGH